MFEATRDEAMASSNSPLLHTELTKTRCLFKRGTCTPQENKKTVMIWDMPAPFPPIFKSTGTQDILIIGKLVTIPTLGSGGLIETEAENSIYLDSNFLIKKTNKTNTKNLSLYEDSLKMAEAMKANQETDRLGAAIAIAIAKIDN